MIYYDVATTAGGKKASGSSELRSLRISLVNERKKNQDLETRLEQFRDVQEKQIQSISTEADAIANLQKSYEKISCNCNKLIEIVMELLVRLQESKHEKNVHSQISKMQEQQTAHFEEIKKQQRDAERAELERRMRQMELDKQVADIIQSFKTREREYFGAPTMAQPMVVGGAPTMMQNGTPAQSMVVGGAPAGGEKDDGQIDDVIAKLAKELQDLKN